MTYGKNLKWRGWRSAAFKVMRQAASYCAYMRMAEIAHRVCNVSFLNNGESGGRSSDLCHASEERETREACPSERL